MSDSRTVAFSLGRVVDTSFQSLKLADFSEGMVMDGIAFEFNKAMSLSSLGVNDTKISIASLTGYEIILDLHIVGSDTLTALVGEDSVGTSSGSYPTFNLNRNSSDSISGITVSDYTSVSSTGDVILRDVAIMGKTEHIIRMQMKQSSDYLLRISNATTSTEQVHVRGNSYKFIPDEVTYRVK